MKRIAYIAALVSLVFLPLAAQEDSFFGDDAGGFGDGFGDAFGDMGGGGSALVLGGTLESSFTVNATDEGLKDAFDREEGADKLVEATSLGLSGTFAGPRSEFVMDLDFSADGVAIQEAYARYFGSLATVTAGYTQVVWGKADEFHVVDALNSLDLSEFLKTDYLEMVIPRPMVKADIPLPAGLLLEAAWIPTFRANEIPMEGSWVPAEMKAARTVIEGAVGYQAAALYAATYGEQMIATAGNEVLSHAVASAAQTQFLAANQHGEGFFADTASLDFSQFGLRLTGSAAGFDYGLVYYCGYNKMPSLTFVTPDGATFTDASVAYDALQVFGLEGSAVLFGLNLKGEAAYYMTEDLDGDDPEVHNNSVKWVGGFDRDLPLSNLNINIQEAGTVILKSDEIVSPMDIEAAAEETENILTVSLSDKYNHEKIEVRLTGMYHFEGEDWSLVPEVTFDLDDNLEASLSGRFYHGNADTLFGQFDENDEIKIGVKYSF